MHRNATTQPKPGTSVGPRQPTPPKPPRPDPRGVRE